MKKRIVSLLLALTMLLGMVPAVSATQAQSAEIVSASMTLKSVLNVEFKADLKDGDPATYSVRVRIGNSAAWKETTRGTEPQDGKYIFTLELPAHRMHETLHVELVNNGETVDSKDWTVRSYVDSLHNNYPDDALMMELVDDMFHYGQYAAYYTGRSNADPAVAEVQAVNAEDLKDYQHSVTKDATDTSEYGAKAHLFVDNSCDLVFTFSWTGGLDGKALYVNGKQVDVTDIGNNRVEYRISDILPQNWGEPVNVVVKADGKDVLTMNYSILSYALSQIRKTNGDAKLQNLMKAMYLYGTAAKTYSQGGQWITLADAPFKNGGTASDEVGVANGYKTAMKFTKTWTANGYAFDDMDLTDYSEVKFAVYSLAWHGIGLDSATLKDNSGKEWRDVRLVKSGTDWDFYYAGELIGTITLPNNNLSDLKLMTGGNDTYYFSEVQAVGPAYITLAGQPFAVSGTTSSEAAPQGYETATALTTTWNKYNFMDLDLRAYTHLRFQVKSSGYYGVMENADIVIDETNGGGNWMEIELKRNGNVWDVYYAGTKQSKTVTAENLADLYFRFGDNTYHITELQGVKDPNYVSPYVFITSDPLNMTGNMATGKLHSDYRFYTDLKNAPQAQKDFIDLDLTNFTEVKFAVKSNGYYSVMNNDSKLNEANNNGNWSEIKLVKEGSGWRISYARKDSDVITLPNNNLSDLKFLLGADTFCITELRGIPTADLASPWVNVIDNPIAVEATSTTERNIPSCDVDTINVIDTSWGQKQFADCDVSGYKALKFYYRVTATDNYFELFKDADLKTAYIQHNNTAWSEVKLLKSGTGWTLYVDGKQVGTGLTGTTLNELIPGLRMGTGTTHVTNLVGYVSEYVQIAENFVNRTSTVQTAGLPSNDVNVVNVISGTAGEITQADGVDIMQYKELLFYTKVSEAGEWFEMYATSGLKNQIWATNSQDWQKVQFKWEESNHVWAMYVNDTWYKTGFSGVELKNIIDCLNFGGSANGTVYVTDLVGILNPDYKLETVKQDPFTLTGTAVTEDIPEGYKYVTEWTTTWNEYNFEDVDLTRYNMVKFGVKSAGHFGMMQSGNMVAGKEPNSPDAYKEILLLRMQAENTWNLYYDGEFVATLTLANNNLTDLNFRFGSNTYYVTELQGWKDPTWVYVSPYVNVADNPVNKTPTSTTAELLPSEDVSHSNIFHTGWVSPGFIEGIEMAKYTELKFWYKVSNSAKWFEMYNGDVTLYQGNATEWTEVKLSPETNGTWTLYINGTGKKWGLTGATLKELIPTLTFGGNVTADVYVTNLIGLEDPNYVEPPKEPGEPENPITLNLVQNGTVNYKLVSGNNDPDYSAVQSHLKKYLEEATGATWAHSQILWVQDTTNSILVGAELALDFDITNQRALDEMGDSDYRITTKDSQIFIYGGTNQGTLNGIYAFLKNHLGLKIYAQDVHCINTVKDLSLTSYTELGNLNYDYLFAGYGEIKPDGNLGDTDDKHGNSMGFVTDYTVMAGNPHGAMDENMISYEEYGSAHSDWFYTVTGTDGSGNTYYNRQLYMAHDDFATGEGSLLATVADKMWAMISQQSQNKFTFGPADIDIWPTGTGYEYSDNLKRTYGSNSAEYIIFMNELAKLIEAKIAASDTPDRVIQLVFLAYNKTLVAPDLTDLSQEQIDRVKLYQGSSVQVVPFVAPVESNYHMTFDNANNKVKNPETGKIDSGSLTVAEMLSGWQKLLDQSNAEELLFWWYSLDSDDYFMVVNTYDNMGYNYYLAKTYGVTSILHQSQYDNEVATDWGRLKIYLQSALARHDHSEMDTEAKGKAVVQQYIDEFMEAYFGPAAEQMQKLMDEQRTWYATVLAISAEDETNPYWLGKLRGSAYTTTYKYRWTDDGGAKVTSLDKWFGDTSMIDRWWTYIEGAKTAINDSSLSGTEKAELIKRVDIEGLVIRNVFIKVMDKDKHDTSVASFYQAAAALGVTHYKEGHAIANYSE